jgi:C1A family cysteine protease
MAKRSRKARKQKNTTKTKLRTDIKVRHARIVPGGAVRVLNVVPSRDTEKDWKFENAVNSGILRATPIPASKDLREPWWKIGDQGDTGSCVGWAAADSVLRWHFTKMSKLSKDNKLSVRFIWMAAKETDEFTSQPTTFIESDGTSLKSALDIARKYGNVVDSTLPFGSNELYKDEPETFYAEAAQLKIASYINLGKNPTKWRQWLAHKGPILTCLECDDTWMNATQTGGVLNSFDAMSADGGHAVAFVGYDANRFIVRNSWGNSWGHNGFAYASNEYAAAAFTEAYGVNVT